MTPLLLANHSYVYWQCHEFIMYFLDMLNPSTWPNPSKSRWIFFDELYYTCTYIEKPKNDPLGFELVCFYWLVSFVFLLWEL